MKQAFGSGDRGEFSGSTRFESKDADFSDDILTQISSMPIGIHAASNQSRRMEVMGEFILVQAILREAIRTYQKYAVKKGTRATRLFRDGNGSSPSSTSATLLASSLPIFAPASSYGASVSCKPPVWLL
jgi:hypothetical protein